MMNSNQTDKFFEELESLIKEGDAKKRADLLENLKNLQFQRDNLRYFALKVLEKDGLWLQHIAVQDSRMVLIALHNNPLALQYCSERVRWSRDFVLYAVSRNGLALEFANNWRDHDPTASVAVDTTPEAIQFVSERLKNDVKWLADRCKNKDPQQVETLLKFVKKELHQEVLRLSLAPHVPFFKAGHDTQEGELKDNDSAP